MSARPRKNENAQQCSTHAARACRMAALGGMIALMFASFLGCGGPQVSGLALGDTRFVTVGDVIELQIPLNDAGRTAWRIADYDSAYLTLVARPKVEDRGGTSVMVILTRARTVGETTLVIESVPTAQERSEGETPRRKSYKINIGERPFSEADRVSPPRPASVIPKDDNEE